MVWAGGRGVAVTLALAGGRAVAALALGGGRAVAVALQKDDPLQG